MSEAAIGGAPAPAETSALAPETATENNPISVQAPVPAEDKAASKAPSASEAIKAAQEKLAAKEAEAKATPKVEAKVEPKPEQPRSETGKFAPRADTKIAPAQAAATDAPGPAADASQSEGRASRYEAPARFNDLGKADWAKAPESVQAEVHRTIKNLEDGYAKHKDAADRFEKVREYDDLARRNGREGVHESLKQVVEIEQAFARNPIEGLKKITDHFGINLQAVAAHIMGQNPDVQVQQAHARIQELEQKIQHMEHAAKAPDIVAEFAASHDRFDELAPTIAVLLKTGTAKDLDAAYELASVLSPGASSAPQQVQTQASPAAESASPAPVAAKPAGQKSISGAPSTGATSSGGKKRILSASEALKQALAQA